MVEDTFCILNVWWYDDQYFGKNSKIVVLTFTVEAELGSEYFDLIIKFMLRISHHLQVSGWIFFAYNHVDLLRLELELIHTFWWSFPVAYCLFVTQDYSVILYKLSFLLWHWLCLSLSYKCYFVLDKDYSMVILEN